MDFCTLVDFLDYVLPHITGPIATVIKKVRGRTATLVSTGSSMATALVDANAQSIQDAPEGVRKVVEETRETVETSLKTDGQVPVSVMGTDSRKVSSANVQLEYVNLPRSQSVYHRGSIEDVFPDFILPSVRKVNLDTSKVGRAGDLLTRAGSNDYRKDGAYFDTVLTTKTLADSRALEGCLKSAIYPYRVDTSQEYYNVQAYLKAHRIVPREGETASAAVRRHLTVNAITTCGDLIDRIYVADLTPVSQRLLESNAPARKYEITIRYNEISVDNYRALYNPLQIESDKLQVQKIRQESLDKAVQNQQELIINAIQAGADANVIKVLQEGLCDIIRPESASTSRTLTEAEIQERDKERQWLREMEALKLEQIAMKKGKKVNKSPSHVGGKPVVEAITAEVLERFINSCTDQDANNKMLIKDAYPVFRKWVMETYHVSDNKTVKKPRFIEALAALKMPGIEYKHYVRAFGRRGGGQQGVEGCELKAQYPLQPVRRKDKKKKRA
jgi:hypothetical protein